jgi:hypothetical protein
VAILIHIYLEIYLGVGLAPSSQGVESLFRAPLWAKPAVQMIYLGAYFLLNPTCKFADSVTKLFGDYRRIV